MSKMVCGLPQLIVLRHPPAELAKAVAGKLCREEFAGRGDA